MFDDRIQRGGLGREAFVRVYAGLRKDLESIEACDGGQVGYLGEWYSHPDGAGMSSRDAVSLATIAEEIQIDAWPATMVIVGEGGRVGYSTQG